MSIRELSKTFPNVPWRTEGKGSRSVVLYWKKRSLHRCSCFHNSWKRSKKKISRWMPSCSWPNRMEPSRMKTFTTSRNNSKMKFSQMCQIWHSSKSMDWWRSHIRRMCLQLWTNHYSLQLCLHPMQTMRKNLKEIRTPSQLTRFWQQRFRFRFHLLILLLCKWVYHWHKSQIGSISKKDSVVAISPITTRSIRLLRVLNLAHLTKAGSTTKCVTPPLR